MKDFEKNCQKIISVDYELIPITQRCNGPCKEHFPATLDYFFSNKSRGNGLGSECKKCSVIERQKRRKNIIYQRTNERQLGAKSG